MLLFRLHRYIKITQKAQLMSSYNIRANGIEKYINLITYIKLVDSLPKNVYDLTYKNIIVLYDFVKRKIFHITYCLPNYNIIIFGPNRDKLNKLEYCPKDKHNLYTEYEKVNNKMCAYSQNQVVWNHKNTHKIKYYYSIKYNRHAKYIQFTYEATHINDRSPGYLIRKIVLLDSGNSMGFHNEMPDNVVRYTNNVIQDVIPKICHIVYYNSYIIKIYIFDPYGMCKFYISTDVPK